jgi:hypothetical protein
MVAELATDILNLDRRLHDVGKTIETELWRHPLAPDPAPAPLAMRMSACPFDDCC